MSPVFNAAGADLKGFDRLSEIVLPRCPAQWKSFAKSGFVDLNNLNAGGLQFNRFVTDGECNLFHRLTARPVVAYKTPLEDGYRTGQHAFDRTIRQ